MNEPLISIVIPVYNVENYIFKCLKSITNQTYKNIEVIMINDGSTDNSRKICDVFVKDDSRFKIFDKINGGLSDARNFGVEKSKGKYITFVDSDDYVDDDYVEYLYRIIKRNGVRMSICQHRTLFNNGKVEGHSYHGVEKISSENALRRLLYSNEIDTSAWAKLYEAKMFDDIAFPFGKLFEDIATTYKFIMKSSYIAVGNQEKYNYVYRSKSIVNGKFNLKKLDLIEMTNGMGKDVVKKYPSLKKGTIRRNVYAEISTLNQFDNVQKYKGVKKNIIKQIRRDGYKVLVDPNSPLRDKMAISLIYLGYPIYIIFWKMYIRLKKGI